MYKLTDARVSVYEDNKKQINTSYEGGKFIIDLLDVAVVDDYVDLDIIKASIGEIKLLREKTNVVPPIPVVISYRGEPLVEISTDGKKKLHPATAAHLGLKLFFHKLVSMI